MSAPEYVWDGLYPDFNATPSNMGPPAGNRMGGTHPTNAHLQPFMSSRNVSPYLNTHTNPAHALAHAHAHAPYGTMKYQQPVAAHMPFPDSAPSQAQFHPNIDIHSHNFPEHPCSTAECISPPCDKEDCDEAAICYDHHSLACIESSYCNDPFHCDDTFACHDATCPVDLACDSICADACHPANCPQEHSQQCDALCDTVPCADPDCHEETLYCCLSDICPHKPHVDCHDPCLPNCHPPHPPYACHHPGHQSCDPVLHETSSQSTLSTPQTSPADSLPTPVGSNLPFQTLLEVAHSTFPHPSTGHDWQSYQFEENAKPRKRRRVDAPPKPDVNKGLEQDLYAIFPELANQGTWAEDCGFSMSTDFSSAAPHVETRPKAASRAPTSTPREGSSLGKPSMAPPYICQWEHDNSGTCNASFTSCEGLHEHVKEHTGRLVSGSRGTNREYKCRWIGCDKTEPFGTKNHLDRHIQNHTGFKPFACTICGHRCVTQQQLTNHLTTHTRSKPFTCDFPGCAKSFSVKTALSTHKRTHTNEKPFRCRFCGDSYSDSSNLSKHRKTVHEDTATAIPCPHPGCEYKDSRQQRLERHCREEGHAQALVREPQRWAEYTGCWKRKSPRSRTGSVARSSVSGHS